MVKTPKHPIPPAGVRSRRAYFDCNFGQLHVRTAFPGTGGFDEEVTLFCLHPLGASSRLFSRLLPELADVRSVYAPDLPGHGESDPSPTHSMTEAATAISALAEDLRLRQIDLLGVQQGAEVALALAHARPALVRRLVLIDPPAAARLPAALQQRLVIDTAGHGEDPFGTAPRHIARRISSFLSGPTGRRSK